MWCELSIYHFPERTNCAVLEEKHTFLHKGLRPFIILFNYFFFNENSQTDFHWVCSVNRMSLQDALAVHMLQKGFTTSIGITSCNQKKTHTPPKDRTWVCVLNYVDLKFQIVVWIFANVCYTQYSYMGCLFVYCDFTSEMSLFAWKIMHDIGTWCFF